ncbi:MAG: class I SAM-dependent methyltransferase [Alcaligenaceae bacterium]|nr:class I SAM-dependent methyltransferase [Alcaligenaceae bacterium]
MAQANTQIINLTQWLNSDPGQTVINWETEKFDQIVSNAFGFNALQLGLPKWNFLRNNRIRSKLILTDDTENTVTNNDQVKIISSSFERLPFPNCSIDLIIMPHILECAQDPHQILREVERVLVYEGRVVITGFNPWSLWGLRNRTPLLKRWIPISNSSLVSVRRLKDWLKLLSLEIDRGHFGCYTPACQTEKWLKRWNFMNKAGDRWWPVAGGVYLLSAVKRARGMHLVGPVLKKKRRKSVSNKRPAIVRQREISQLFNIENG